MAALTTLMPDGQPQTTVVWSSFDGHDVLVNTMRGFRKERNMRRDRRVTLLAYDPRRPLQYLEVRGRVVEMTEKGALEQLDELSLLYTGRAPYFGGCVPRNLKDIEVPVLCKISPVHVVRMDATENNHPKVVYDDQTPELESTAGKRRLVMDLPQSVCIPDSHTDLLERPFQSVLTTLMPGGHPQSSLVWHGYDGECARVNTTLQRQKGRNMLADPRISLLVVDPEDTSRYIQIQGLAEIVRDGAVEDLDELTRKYTKQPGYYGYIYPVEQKTRETRVRCRIRATRITVDAIHR